MLFRRRFTHCAMAIPFILHSLPCSSIFLARCESHLRTRGTTGFRISSMVAKILESGILTFINILVKLCIYPYIVNHVIWIALFGIQESLESSQESWNQARNLGILPRFRITSKKIHSVGPLAFEGDDSLLRLLFITSR